MSLQWSLVAALLYTELALTSLLLLPTISNRLWTAALSLTRIRSHILSIDILIDNILSVLTATVDNIKVRAWQRIVLMSICNWLSKILCDSFPPTMSIDICNFFVFRRLEKQAIYYFYVVVCVLLLAFLDSIREMQKYAQRDESVKVIKSSFAARQ